MLSTQKYLKQKKTELKSPVFEWKVTTGKYYFEWKLPFAS